MYMQHINMVWYNIPEHSLLIRTQICKEDCYSTTNEWLMAYDAAKVYQYHTCIVYYGVVCHTILIIEEEIVHRFMFMFNAMCTTLNDN